jgi:hypothetical protein
MVKAVLAIVVGAIAIGVAWLISSSYPDTVVAFNGALGLASDVFGFFGVSLAVATIGSAAAGGSGLASLDAREVQGTAALRVIGAILLAA